MQDLNTIWSSCIETLGKNNIVEDKILLESIFENAVLESIDDNHVIITTDFRWNIETILEKKTEIEVLGEKFTEVLILDLKMSAICQKHISIKIVKFRKLAM